VEQDQATGDKTQAAGESPQASGGERLSAGSAAAEMPLADMEAILEEAAEAMGEGNAPRSGGSRGRVQTEDSSPAEDTVIGEKDIEFLLNQAQQALSSMDEAPDQLPPGVKRFQWDDFSGTPASSEAATLDLVRDVELDLQIELGRTHMHLADVLRLKKGSVVPLDKLAGDPVDIYVNDRLIARGEVLVLNDNFCVRVAELVVGDGANPN
jgi:flagellar motor switch protein FliN/FliY